MAQRGRKPKPSLTVVPLDVTIVRPRLTAPSILTKGERALFAEAAAINLHLRPADTPLLALYVQALAKTYRLARQSDAAAVAAWEKSARTTMALARSLRITTQSQVHPEFAGRKRQIQQPSFYETMETGDE
jgi:hypothetical protein